MKPCTEIALPFQQSTAIAWNGHVFL